MATVASVTLDVDEVVGLFAASGASVALSEIRILAPGDSYLAAVTSSGDTDPAFNLGGRDVFVTNAEFYVQNKGVSELTFKVIVIPR